MKWRPLYQTFEKSFSFYRQGRQLLELSLALLRQKNLWLFSAWSRIGLALRRIFISDWSQFDMANSCGKFMQHLETCLLIANLIIEDDRVLCHLAMFFAVLIYSLDVQN